MNPAGVIITYMGRQDWKGKKFLVKARTIFFNICLFLGQLIFMVVGKIIGKVKVKWRRVWRAAQASHVRLVLEEPNLNHVHYSLVANFGHPTMEVQNWHDYWNDGKRFEYRDPTFPASPEFIEAMIGYAHDQEGKGYDDLQLLSNGLHLIAWIIYPPCWGKEIKIIKALNRKGGREHCISGVTACLRWGEPHSFQSTSLSFEDIRKAQESLRRASKAKVDKKYIARIKEYTGRFFKGYSTATTFPCMVPISENWRKA